MAGREEAGDYMGDLSLFLPPEDIAAPKKKFEPTSAPKVKRQKTLTWQEHRRLEKERKQREDDEHTKARLDTAIPESNLGFRMLRQMGYKPGTALGKEACGIAKPIVLEIRRTRAGIGRETQEEAAERKEREAAERFRVSEKKMAAEFGSWQSTQWREKKVVRDYYKAEATLAHLENREVLEVEEEEDEKEKTEEAEEDVVITEEELHELLLMLRKEHYYCLYCGCMYESEAALENACPGLCDEDH